MDPASIGGLPFLTRQMLNLPPGASLSLIVRSQSDFAQRVVVRGLTREGAFSLEHTPLDTGAIKTESFSLTDIPIFISVQDVDNLLVAGETFVQIDLAINGDIVQKLAAGFVFGSAGISWPMTNLKDSIPNQGYITTKSSSNPAAGSELSYTVPANQFHHLNAIRFSLVTDGNAANRRVHVVISNGIADIMDFISSVDHAASTTRNYSVMPIGEAGTLGDDNDIIIPMPNGIKLYGGMVVKTITTNKQAGDDFGVMSLQVEQFWQNV